MQWVRGTDFFLMVIACWLNSAQRSASSVQPRGISAAENYTILLQRAAMDAYRTRRLNAEGRLGECYSVSHERTGTDTRCSAGDWSLFTGREEWWIAVCFGTGGA